MSFSFVSLAKHKYYLRILCQNCFWDYFAEKIIFCLAKLTKFQLMFR